MLRAAGNGVAVVPLSGVIIGDGALQPPLVQDDVKPQGVAPSYSGPSCHEWGIGSHVPLYAN